VNRAYYSGATSPVPTTEAESYARLAIAASILSPVPSTSSTSPAASLSNQTEYTTESFALDSFQNLLFALARFREYTGRYPIRITVVGYSFKQRRFEELHRTALRWPTDKFTYIGIGLPDAADEAQAAVGEVSFFHQPTANAHGGLIFTMCFSSRNPFDRL
jgi:hypothetical protein